MALTTCRECGKEVSDSAKTCPHCGVDAPGNPAATVPATPAAPAPGEGGVTALIFVIIVGLVLWWIFSPGDDEEPATDNTAEIERREAELRPSPGDQARVKQFITSRGMWCGQVERFYEKPFKSSVNRKVYYAFCDDGNNAVIYEIQADRNGVFESVTEE